MTGTPTKSPRTGIAFSGGGVRSAALSSGVLRRLLHKSVSVDYISCVSGGGYAIAAYLDWKVRNGKKDDPVWHKEFFAHLRRRINVFCDWEKPLHGILDTIIVFLVVLMITIIVPVLIWSPYAFPLAYVVNFFFRSILRAEDSCRTDQAVTGVCRPQVNSKAYYRTVLFAVTGTTFVLLYELSKRLHKLRGYLRVLAVISGVIFFMTFTPWITYEFLSTLPTYVHALIILGTMLMWYIFPLLRSKAFMVLLIYAYADVIFWKVYELPVFGVAYNEYYFHVGIFISGILMWCAPILRSIHQRAAFTYVRWLHQKAFYHPSGIGFCGCRGFNCLENFQYCLPCRVASHIDPKSPIEDRSLTLADLSDIKPHFISNIVVNEWRTDEKSLPYELLMFSPTGIERIHPKASSNEFHNKLNPEHIKLSEAMLMSAGAVARRMGNIERRVEHVKPFIALLGLTFGAAVHSDKNQLEQEGWCSRSIPLIANIVRLLPLVICPMVWFLSRGTEIFIVTGVLSYVTISLLLSIIAIQKTGSENPGKLERITRWFIAHDELVRFIRNLVRIINVGPMPPAVLELSDGGHFENLGLLPLLKKRLKKMVVVDAGRFTSDEDYPTDMIEALRLARDRLHCSFIGYNGRDVIEDIRESFGRKRPGEQPRSYRFRVHYYEKESIFTEGRKVGEGEILLLAPRHPNKGLKTTTRMTWHSVGQDLEAGLWGTGPELDAEEVDRLTGCCLECCHGCKLRGISEAILGKFPSHSTANQLLTPSIFSAYHREGYRACVEGGADEFLRDDEEPITTQPITVQEYPNHTA